MSAPAIEIQNLRKEFRVGFFRRKVQAVKNVSLKVQPGEIFGFLGPNGAGKTTTIKSMMGLIFPSEGDVKIFGVPAHELDAKERIGFLPQAPTFYEYLSGREFLDFYGRLFEIPRDERDKRVNELLEMVGLTHAADTMIRKYSGGMIQRIGLAQALINNPDLIILDEPMAGLDPIGRKDVRDIIFRLRSEGKTVFFSSHILQDVEMICDRVAIMTHGVLRKVGPLRELLEEMGEQHFELTVRNADNALKDQLTGLGTLVRDQDSLLTISLVQAKREQALELVKNAGNELLSLIPVKGTLEDIFVQQVNEEETENTTSEQA